MRANGGKGNVAGRFPTAIQPRLDRSLSQAIRRSARSGCLANARGSRASVGPDGGSRLNPDKECSDVGHDASNAGGWRPFRPSDAPVESQDGTVHSWEEEQDSHHQPEGDRARPSGPMSKTISSPNESSLRILVPRATYARAPAPSRPGGYFHRLAGAVGDA